VKTKVGVFIELYRQAQKIKRQGQLLAESERREKEYRLAELKRSEELRFRTLADSIPEIIWSANSEGIITYYNQRWVEYTALILDELGDIAWKKGVHPEDQERVLQSWREALATGHPFESEFRLLRARDQIYRWHLGRAVPLRNDQGDVVEWFGTATDIEAQKRSETELQNTIHARDEFLSIASHELKTPVTSLKLELQILDRKMKKNSQELIPAAVIQGRLTTAIRQTGRIENLIENLLDISRIRTGKLGIDTEMLDFTSIVNDLVARMGDLARASGSSISVSSEGPVEGYYDSIRIEQVISNLISNAIKYGEGKPIEVTIRSDTQAVILTVRDHGIGISKEDQDRIFERFERAVSSRNFGGLGLGLYISKEIIQAHGGSIRVESDLKHGSTFTISLPRNIPLSPEALKTEVGEDPYGHQRTKKSC
jgi:PAS domain S-box-containing protein